MFGKSKKKKPDNSFEPYLWSFEEVLWQSRPYASFGEYASQSPVDMEFTDAQSDDFGIEGCVFILSFFIMFTIGSFLLAFSNDLVVQLYNSFNPLFGLVLMCLGGFLYISVSFFISGILAFISKKFVFRVGEKQSAWYAVTTHRIYWRFRKQDWRYIDYKNLYKVVIREGSDGDTLEWHGYVPQYNNPHGSQIPKIVFLGVYGAEDVIAKAQAQCDHPLEVVDEREPDKAKHQAPDLMDEAHHDAQDNQQAKS